MKTPEDIEQLKRNWEYDPIWDIEETEGFEAHVDELLSYRLQKEAEWNQARQVELLAKAEKLGVPGNVKLAAYVEILENKIDQMNQTLENIYFR